MIENLDLTPISLVRNLSGLSTDIKPTKNIGTGSRFYEINTGDTYVYSVLNVNPITNNGWWKIPATTGGGTGMINIDEIMESATRVFVTPEQRDMIGSGGNITSVRAEDSLNGERSTGVGLNFVAAGSDSLALGNNACAFSDNSIAIGNNSAALQGHVAEIDYASPVDATHYVIVQKNDRPPLQQVSVGDTVYISYDAQWTSLKAFEVSSVSELEITIIVPEGFYFEGQPKLISVATQEPGTALAIGQDAQAMFTRSVALGQGARTAWRSQTVLGCYNKPNVFDAFQIGAGEDAGNLRNILSLDWDGNMSIAGNSITLGNGTVLGTTADEGQPAAVVMEASTETPGVDGEIVFSDKNKVTVFYVESQTDVNDYENQTQTVFLLLGWDNLVKLSGPDPEGYTLEDYTHTPGNNTRSYKVVWTSGYHRFYVSKLV